MLNTSISNAIYLGKRSQLLKYLLVFLCALSSHAYADGTEQVDYNDKIIGMWSCSATLKEAGTILSLAIDSDYVRNARSNSRGSIKLDMADPEGEGKRIKLDYFLSGTGSWRIKDNKYLIEVTEEIKIVNMTDPLMDKLFSLESLFPKNISSSSEIIKLDDKTLVIKNESDGNEYTCKRKPKKNSTVSKLKDSDGYIYIVTYNENGAILKNVMGQSIYVGNSCDAFSKQLGGGEWGHANSGMMITLGDKVVSFPNQKVSIQDCNL